MNPTIEDNRRTAKVYFTAGFEVLAKDLAASIRNQQSHAHLIDQKNFESEQNVLECDAVLIQATARNARKIGRAYSEFGTRGVEILFFDDEGRITKLELVEPTQSFANLLGGTDEKDDTANTEPAPAGVLGQGTGTSKDAGDDTAGRADTTEGDSEGDA